MRDWQEAGGWTALHRVLLERLQAAGQIDWRWTSRLFQPRGICHGTDRGKPGTKRHIAVDARGTPLGVLTGPANQHDSRMLAPTLDAIPPVRSGRCGRPRQRPDKLHANKGHDYRHCRKECRARGIQPRIARHGVESSQRFGRHRWVVERTHAWLNCMRRLTVRYERRADIYQVFTTLGCVLVCLRQIRRFCWAFLVSDHVACRATSSTRRVG